MLRDKCMSLTKESGAFGSGAILRGLRQKETVSRTPERIPAEGQRDLLDIIKPRQK